MKLVINTNHSDLMTGIVHRCTSGSKQSDTYHVIFTQDDDYENNKYHVRLGPSGKSSFVFKEITFEVDFAEIGKPRKHNNRVFDTLKQITIEGDCTPEIMEQLCEQSMKEYDEYNTNLQHKVSDTMTIYEYDFGWSRLFDKDKRPLNRIYLSKKLDKQVNELRKQLSYFVTEECNKMYKNLCIPHRKIIMLSGPPGTGKTSLIHSIASEYEHNVGIIEFNKDLGDRQLRNALRRFPKKMIIVIEDIDCLFDQRKSNDDFKNSITFSGLLNALDGIVSGKNCIIFITTNHLENLDSALKRRIDCYIEFDYASEFQIKVLLETFFPDSSSENLNICAKTMTSVNTTTNVVQKYAITKLPKREIDNCDDFMSFHKAYKSEKMNGMFL